MGLGASGGSLETQRLSHPARAVITPGRVLSPLTQVYGGQARPVAGAVQDRLTGCVQKGGSFPHLPTLLQAGPRAEGGRKRRCRFD